MKGQLVVDEFSRPIQGFVPDPAKCLGAKNANTVFKVGSGGDVDITGWLALVLYPAGDGTVAFNNDAAKIMPIYGGVPNVIIIHPGVTQIVPSVACTAVCGQ